MHREAPRAFLLGSTLALVGCSSPPGVLESNATEQAPIVGGTLASSYPEAALIAVYTNGTLTSACTGSVIAPQVALTAGHCVYGYDGWDVTVPYNGGQSTHSTNGAVLDYMSTSTHRDPSLHDVGLIFFDSPMQVSASQCPVLASAPLHNNDDVVNVGRRDNGTLSHTDLYVGAATPVTLDPSAFPNDYEGMPPVTEDGDSGGPAEVPGSSPHEIVAVTSSGNSTVEIMARVDLVHSWIEQQVGQHGGFGPCAGGGGSSSGSGGSGSGSSGGSSSGAAVGGSSSSGSAGTSAAGGNSAGWGSSSKGGCNVAGIRDELLPPLAPVAFLAISLFRRRSRSEPAIVMKKMVSTILMLCAGCGAPALREPGETTGTSGESLTGTLTEATAYPEAAQLDLGGGICSGAIIAPQVVLTAGHCGGAATVTAPYNGHQVLHGTQSATFDWNGDPATSHDVGLLFLDSPATLSAAQCPVLAQKPVADGTNVVNLGVRKDGALPTHTVWVDVPHPVQSGANCQWQDDYCTQAAYLEDGDSGGPVETSGSSPHEIVAVNSATTAPQGNTDALARVDLVYSWIEQQIQQHGGHGPCTGTPGSSSSGGGSSGSGTGSSGGSSGTSGSSGGSGSNGDGGGGNGGGTSGGSSGAGPSAGGSGGTGGAWNGASSGSGGCGVAPVGKRSGETALSLGLVLMAAIRRRKQTKSRGVER